MLCQSHSTAVGLDVVEQHCDAVMNQCLYVSAMLYNAIHAAVLLVSISCMLRLACYALSVSQHCSGPGCC